jgi:hypothetical protein
VGGVRAATGGAGLGGRDYLRVAILSVEAGSGEGAGEAEPAAGAREGVARRWVCAQKRRIAVGTARHSVEIIWRHDENGDVAQAVAPAARQ